jgi:N-acetylmuramoyl-L-alanine amidase
MTATLNRAEAGWNDPPLASSGPRRELAPVPANDGGRNALQALFAFASLHQQAAKHRTLKNSDSSADTVAPSSETELALDEILHSVAERALSITGADGVAIAIAEPNAIICRASAGRIAPDPGIKLDPDSGFSGACLRSGQTVRCDDSETDPRVNPQACRNLGTRSMIAVPLSARQRVVGLIEAFSTETFGFNDKDVRSLNLLGELILAAIRPEEDRLAELAYKIVAPPAPATPPEIPLDDVLVTIPYIPAKVIVDEKFVPPARETASAQPAIEAAPAPETLEEPVSASPAKAAPVALFERTPEETEEGRSVSRVLLIAAIVLVVMGLAAAAVWKVKYAESAPNTSPDPNLPQQGQTAPIVPMQPAAPEAKTPAISKVTGIHHSSSETASTVVIDLQDQVQYEAHTLDNPSRIYFDLHDTRIASGPGAQDIEVNDAFLKRIRMAQPTDGVTRVVLETKADSQYSISFDSNPYRLTIAVHKAAAVPVTTPALKAPPVPLPKPSPVVVAPKRATESKPTPSLNPADFQIVLDAGHGGWDLGTVGRKGLLEKDLVLDIVQRLGKLIETKMGAQVIYTRQDDSYLPLEKRAEIANVAKADMFLSVHANYSDLATARGVETYYTTTYSSVKARTDSDDPSLKNVDWTGVDIRSKVTDSHHLAADIQQTLYAGLAANNPEIRNRGVKEAQYVVLTGTQMPAVLAEVSFVSSPADEARLENSAYRQHIAEALYRGVAQYHREITHTKLASAKKLVHR